MKARVPFWGTPCVLLHFPRHLSAPASPRPSGLLPTPAADATAPRAFPASETPATHRPTARAPFLPLPRSGFSLSTSRVSRGSPGGISHGAAQLSAARVTLNPRPQDPACPARTAGSLPRVLPLLVLEASPRKDCWVKGHTRKKLRASPRLSQKARTPGSIRNVSPLGPGSASGKNTPFYV